MVLCCVAVLAAGCGNATAQFPPNSGQACPVASPQPGPVVPSAAPLPAGTGASRLKLLQLRFYQLPTTVAASGTAC